MIELIIMTACVTAMPYEARDGAWHVACQEAMRKCTAVDHKLTMRDAKLVLSCAGDIGKMYNSRGL